MTERTKRYLELKELIADAIDKDDDALYDMLGRELVSLKKQMTVGELRNLEQYVSKRAFHMGVLPLIKEKQVAQRSARAAYNELAAVVN